MSVGGVSPDREKSRPGQGAARNAIEAAIGAWRPPAISKRRRVGRFEFDPRDFTVYLSLVLVFAFFAITIGDEGFLTSYNLKNVAIQAAPIAIMSLAMVFVLSAGEIDLSIGSTVALTSLVAGTVMQEQGVVLGIAAGMGTGLAVGLANGLLITKARIPSFLVTLAALELVGGLARRITNLKNVAVTNNWFDSTFGGGEVLGISTMILWGLGAVLVAGFVFRRRRLGAHTLATGDNREAAITAGINVDRVRMIVFLLSGAAASLAGLLYSGRVEAARYTLGENDTLTVIAAVIIGGTSLFGGRGAILGAAIGALLLSMINNGLILFGLSPSDQQIALGIVIILAVVFGRGQEA
jgi:ribose transport system permease protein